jgi:hypothetical protein
LVPDWSDQESVLGDPECPFGLRKLDVSFSERDWIYVVKVVPQDVATFRDVCPLIPALVALPAGLQLRLSHRLEELLNLNDNRPRGPSGEARQAK